MGFDLANYLTDLKYSVTVLCPQPSRPSKAIYGDYSNIRFPVINIENGVNVVRLPSFASPKSRLFSRMFESFSFGREVTKYLSDQEIKPDALYVNCWPIFAQTIIAKVSKKYHLPFVLQIMDIYPEALISRLPLFVRLLINWPLKKLDTWAAKTAASVIVISQNMRRIYVEDRQIPAQRVSIIFTWQNEDFFDKVISRSESCRQYKISQQPFTFLYLGNIGPVSGVDVLIRAFAEASISNAQLLIVGDGVAKFDCVDLVSELNLSSVHFISDLDAANVPVLQSMAHVCMLPMKRGNGMSSIPSKLPSYLFSAKPVIATVDLDSDTAHFIRQAECGWVGEPEDLIWLAAKMKEVSEFPREKLECLGKNGKRYGLMHFSKKSGVVRLANKILEAAGVDV